MLTRVDTDALFEDRSVQQAETGMSDADICTEAESPLRPPTPSVKQTVIAETWNVRGLTTVTIELQERLKATLPGVIVLTETIIVTSNHSRP